MITTKKALTIYEVEDTINKLKISVKTTPDTITLRNKGGGKEFVFDCDKSKERRHKWRQIGKMIIKACDLV